MNTLDVTPPPTTSLLRIVAYLSGLNTSSDENTFFSSIGRSKHFTDEPRASSMTLLLMPWLVIYKQQNKVDFYLIFTKKNKRRKCCVKFYLKEAHFFASLVKFLNNYGPCLGVVADQVIETDHGHFWRF